jgi:hypothetical protein
LEQIFGFFEIKYLQWLLNICILEAFPSEVYKKKSIFHAEEQISECAKFENSIEK